ncbi:MAG: carbamoyl-phosphate synthase (glutamine-hydrolyzing) large subunit [Deltaproteobacteria bacterium]|nr:carbamoyl-phosphate synthase (glutamine-hydrolyzing) large subunit [Deltaproteobacteria bacterium]
MYGAYLPKKPKRVLILGSGALQIGQAGEFDYSGTQALKALREERIYTVLINPNIATIQTSEDLADRVYLVAVTPDIVERVIAKEEVDGILLSFGGQTALNCGIELHRRGVLAKYGVRVLGTPVEAISDTEDRERFVERLREIGVHTARSRACASLDEAMVAAKEIGLPVILRSGFSLGGKGSAVATTEKELKEKLQRAFLGGATQVLVEEYLKGWKEIEYEVVRDFRDNCITVCNMENFDPMGIHTGESIVVAPSQTLDDEEYQVLRSVAVRTIRHLGIVGECNIQYALSPRSAKSNVAGVGRRSIATGGVEYRVIEVNARLSRSSALASKATGYPLAYVAAKLALGYTLPEIPNGITRRTTSFFEPALDYIVCKFPRWDLGKFRGASTEIGTEMKSVGEVMAIGRSFPEVIQKAVRMLDIGVHGVDPGAYRGEPDAETELKPTPTRIFALARALAGGRTVDEIHDLTRIDRWFLSQLQRVVDMHQALAHKTWPLDTGTLREAKQLGFSDQAIAQLTGSEVLTVRAARKSAKIEPELAKIDTLAAEFPAETNYLYSSYQATASEAPKSRRKKILVLGSGTYRIGSSVEFDWCCVSAVKAAAELGYETIMLNYNPETVSTDYDMCDQLIFDEISFESVLDAFEREQPEGVVVSMGGQIPNNLALKLDRAGVKILGTSAKSIDVAEDRRKFSALCDELEIAQPKWFHMTSLDEAEALVGKLGGFPVLVRPSYVLSGAAMSVAHEPNELRRILERAKAVSPEQPVVVSAFEMHAREIEIDAVADQGEIVLWVITEHTEDAGVHSGDATLMLPPQTISIPTIMEARKVAEKLAKALEITGPFNLQLLAKNNSVRVIECNLRASRSFPFVSKVTGNNFVREAMRRMLGVRGPVVNRNLDLDYVAAKVPQFSFSRLVGADPMLGVEMASTGEVGCFGDDGPEALLHALLATGFQFPKRGVLLSLGPIGEKYSFLDEARVLHEELKLPLYATEGTAEVLQGFGIPCVVLAKQEGDDRSAMEAIEAGKVDLVINVPREYDQYGRPDGYLIRRRAVDTGVPLITDLQLARAVVEALRKRSSERALRVLAWDEYLGRRPTALG